MVANLLAFGLAACATLISALPTANIQPGDVVDPTPLQPVIVVAPAAVAIDNYPNKQIDFTGKARVYTFDAAADIQDGKVKVHFSVDNWKTVADVDARFAKDTKEFAWTVVLPDGLHPTNVVYAVRYDSSKGTFWDNNNGKNYVVPVDYPVLAPTATAPPTPSSTSTAPAQTSTPGSGQTFALALTPDQPTTNVEGVIEFQPVLSSDPQSLVGFVDSQAPVAFTSAFAINTGKLSNGVHTVTIRAEFGDSAQIATQQFTVNNTLKFVDMWKPVNTVDQDFSDSSLVAQDGKVYVAYEKTVARYASYGAAEPEQIFDGYVQSKYIGISGFTVHDGVVTTLFSNGDLEQRTYYNEPITMFGNQGKVNVNDIPDISNWCSFASLMHVEAKQLLLGNSCQAGRIFKFDILTGKYLGFVNVTGSPAYLTKDDKGANWVLTTIGGARKLKQINLATLQLLDGVEIPVPADVGFGQFQVVGDYVYAPGQENRLIVFDKTGAKVGSWLGNRPSDSNGDESGTWYVLSGVIRLPDGTVAGQSFYNTRFQRFDKFGA